MGSYNITRSIDQLGRIVLPVEFRRELGIQLGDPLDILLTDGHIEIRRTIPACRLCGSKEELTAQKDVWICRRCIDSLIK